MRGRVVRFAAAFQALLLMATLVLPALAAATEISTDLWVYQDGDTVTVNGIDFGANEVVRFVTTDPLGAEVDAGSATSDGLGNVVYAFVLHATESGLYDITATGESSGFSATTQFDPPNPAQKVQFVDDRSMPSPSIVLSWTDSNNENCFVVY